MKTALRQGPHICGVILSALVTSSILLPIVTAQSPGIQEKVAELKEALARNRQALSQYTWQEQVTISVKGEQKKQEHFQVRLGPDGKPQKTSLDPPQPPSGSTSRRHGRLKEHIIEKKKEEYKDYADQIKALVQRYVPPEKDLLQSAFQKGNIAISPEGDSGVCRLVISSYVKQADSVTLVVDRAQRELASLSISTYLDNPSDVVKVSAQFAPLPDGPNHVTGETIEGVSKQLVVSVQNSNYQRLQQSSALP